VEFIGKLQAINKVIYNRQLALFYANHNLNLNESLQLAQTELMNRKDIYAYDTYAWALYKNGRYTEAADAMQNAMRLHTRDALLYYHTGMIYKALDDHAQAETFLSQALLINPHFDLLQARIAQSALTNLQIHALVR
jgi:tetratricopeptide (TPR) repeat protein